MPVDRVRLSVAVRSGSSASGLLAAIRDYALEKAGKPWLLHRRRPLVLRHASPKAEGVSYAFARDDAGVRLRVVGKRARLGLAYAVTMLANTRFAEHVEQVTIELDAER